MQIGLASTFLVRSAQWFLYKSNFRSATFLCSIYYSHLESYIFCFSILFNFDALLSHFSLARLTLRLIVSRECLWMCGVYSRNDLNRFNSIAFFTTMLCHGLFADIKISCDWAMVVFQNLVVCTQNVCNVKQSVSFDQKSPWSIKINSWCGKYVCTNKTNNGLSSHNIHTYNWHFQRWMGLNNVMASYNTQFISNSKAQE